MTIHKTTTNILTLVISALIFTSCQQEEKPVTKQEATEFARNIEVSMEKRDGSIMDDAMDEDALVKRMNVKGEANSASFRSGLKSGLRIGSELTKTLSEKGTYSLVKQYEKDHTQHLLFRMYDNGMINYHDLELDHRKGKVMIADIFIYMTGENFSETMKRLMAEFGDRMVTSSIDDETMSSIREIAKVRSLITSKRHQEALDIYNKIPEEMKKSRPFQLLHIEICSGLDDEQYEKAIAEYQSMYPNEANMQLVLIDGFILHRQYEKALNAVDELDKSIDKDPLLDYHRALCYGLMTEDAKKRECLERLSKNMPDFEDGQLELIADYLRLGEFDKAKPVIDRFKTRSAFSQTSLQTLLDHYPAYQG